VQENGKLCRYCVLFLHNQVGHSSNENVDLLVTKAFNRWKDAKQKFNFHQNTN